MPSPLLLNNDAVKGSEYKVSKLHVEITVASGARSEKRRTMVMD